MSSSSEFSFEKVKQVCEKLSIPMEHVLVLTVQKNWTTQFFSVCVDFDKKDVLKLYGSELQSMHKEMKYQGFNIEYATGLPPTGASDKETDFGKHCVNMGTSNPFCCCNLMSYKNRYLDQESAFHSFMDGTGDSGNYVFEVRRQVNNGPILGLLHLHYFFNPSMTYTRKIKKRYLVFRSRKRKICQLGN